MQPSDSFQSIRATDRNSPAHVPHCPHCGDRLEPALSTDTTLNRCRGCGFVFPTPPDESADPIVQDHQIVPDDRYRLIKPLTSFRHGRVYLARHRVLDELCVIKILKTADPDYSARAAERFATEAKAGFRIKHANVSRVLDCACVEGNWYFVMEYVAGTNLASVVRACEKLPWTQVVDVAVQVGQGLGAIHAAGLAHRDIKPDNILLGPDGSAKITDLGLAELWEAARNRQEGLGVGTPSYLAPELRTGGTPTERSDLYAFGATLYHLLVGHPPMRGCTGPLDYLVGGDDRAPLDWPEHIVPPVPHRLREIVDTCLSVDPRERYAAAHDVVALLRRVSAVGLDPTATAEAAFRSRLGTPSAVVVARFANLSGEASLDWFGQALAEEIQNALIARTNRQVVDRHELQTSLERTAPEASEKLSGPQLLEHARRLGAGVVLRGAYQKVGQQIKVTIQRVDSRHPVGEPILTVSGRADDLFRLEADVVEQLVMALGGRGRQKDEQPAVRPGKKARRHYGAAWTAFVDGHYARAIEHCRQAEAETPVLAEAVSLRGVCHARLGAYDQAIACHRQLERIAVERGNRHRQMEAVGNLGTMYYFKGEYPHAFELMRRASELASELNLLPQLAKLSNNMGYVLTRMERLAEADQVFAESIRIKERLGAAASLIAPNNGRGEIALRAGRLHDALSFFRHALKWAIESNDAVQTGICHAHQGRCHLALGEQEAAESHLNQALSGLAATEFWSGMTLAYEQLAELNLQRSRSEAAFDFIEKRIELARRHGNRHLEASAWEQKSRAYELMGRKDEAIACLKKSFGLQQSKSPYEPVTDWPIRGGDS